MGDTGQPPPGDPPNLHPTPAPTQSTTTPEKTGGGPEATPCRMRSFEEIVADEKKNRNILIVKLVKIVTIVNGKEEKEKNLTMEDVGELLFDVVKLKVEECDGLSLSTSRYDTKEIKLKPGTDPTPYLIQDPIVFKGHTITIYQQRIDITKVTFKNVPWDIPNEEIINLCEVYGTPINNRVKYEAMPRAYRGIRGPHRSVEMKMKPGKQFENFYWMEGPLEEDRGCRVTVLHNGQEQQCSHCLKRGNCPGGGNGKACQMLNTPRGKIAEYMKYLKNSHNYLSLKMKHKMKQEQEFPALGRRNVEDDGFGHMVEKETEVSDDHLEGILEITTNNENPTENVLKVDPADYIYDEENDAVKPKDNDAFDKLVEQHPTVHKLKRGDTRDEKIAGLKTKVLDTLKVVERKKRDMSYDSVKSGCSGWDKERGLSTDSRGEIRQRSDDEDDHVKPKKTQRPSRPLLRPPKILVTK